MTKLPDIISTKAIGCLCTCDEKCNPSGATIFYIVKDNKLYCITHEDSLKVQHIKNNPNVCFVIADNTKYNQIQLYATARIVDNPGDYIPLLEKAIEAHSVKTNEMIPYMNIKNEGNTPVVLELTPKNSKVFEPSTGLTVQKHS